MIYFGQIYCHSCNIGFGFLKEDILILKNAIKYKKKWDFKENKINKNENTMFDGLQS